MAVRLLLLVILVAGPAQIVACRDKAPTEAAKPLLGGHLGLMCMPGFPGCDPAPIDDPLPPIPADSFAVICIQDNPIRGNPVRCAGYFGVPKAFKVVERNAKGKGFNTTLTDTIDVPADSSRYRWYGDAVASTKVTIRVVYQDSTNHLRRKAGQAAYVVQPRLVLEPVMTAPRAVYDTLLLGLTPYPFVRNPAVQGSFMAIWGYYFDALHTVWGESPEASDPQFVLGRGSGPNSGLVYWKTWLQLADSSISYVHPALSGNPVSARWYNEQTGPEPDKCARDTGIDTLLKETKRHEGVTMNDTSHFGITRQLLQEVGFEAQMESSYAIDSVHLLVDTQTRIDNIMSKFWKRQQAFEPVDYKRIWGIQSPGSRRLGRIGCLIAFDSVYIDSIARNQ